MQKLFSKINLLLTSKRLKYPWLIGGALWAAWLFNILIGKGNTDLAGHLVGTDFVAFYTAGKIILMDRSPELYSLEMAHTIQQELYGGFSFNFNPYLNPPHYALLMVPFAWIPYPWAPLIWIGLGLAGLWLSIKLLGAEHSTHTFFLALTWLPVFYAASFGQNAFLSLLVFSLTYFLWKRNHSLLAGMIFSLLFYKPQLMIGVGLLWLLDWRKNWKALLGFGIGCLIQIFLNFWLLPDATRAYITYALKINSNLMSVEGFPMWNAFSVQAFWLALLPGFKGLAQVVYFLCSIFFFYFFLRFWKKNRNHQVIMFSATVTWLVLTIPYIMVYDWTLLLVPAILLWENVQHLRSQWQATFAFLWVITFVSGVFTFAMLRFLPYAIQISIPALFLAAAAAYQSLMVEPPLAPVLDISSYD